MRRARWLQGCGSGRLGTRSPPRRRRSWRSAGIETDLSFEAVQETGLAHGLVDNTSCAVDERWQAVRFVYRLADRPRA